MSPVIKTGASQTKEKWRDDYRTPPHIISAAEKILGEGWFDPFPSNYSSGAAIWDGFSYPWEPNAFVNPPFSRYKEAVDHGLTQPGPQIWICHTNNASGWFKKLLANSTSICLLNDRVRFIDPRTGLPSDRPVNHSCVIYRDREYRWSDRRFNFKEIFSELGRVLYVD